MNESMKLTKAIFMLPLLLLIALAAGAPDEAMGRVSKVVDGDTFDVTLESHDSRISEDLIRIRRHPGGSRPESLRSREEGISIHQGMAFRKNCVLRPR